MPILFWSITNSLPTGFCAHVIGSPTKVVAEKNRWKWKRTMQIWLCYGTISKMHVERQAPITLAVIQIPWLREKSKQTKQCHGCANRCKNADSKVADRSVLVLVIGVVVVSGGYGFDEFWNAGVLIMFSFHCLSLLHMCISFRIAVWLCSAWRHHFKLKVIPYTTWYHLIICSSLPVVTCMQFRTEKLKLRRMARLSRMRVMSHYFLTIALW